MISYGLITHSKPLERVTLNYLYNILLQYYDFERETTGKLWQQEMNVFQDNLFP